MPFHLAASSHHHSLVSAFIAYSAPVFQPYQKPRMMTTIGIRLHGSHTATSMFSFEAPSSHQMKSPMRAPGKKERAPNNSARKVRISVAGGMNEMKIEYSQSDYSIPNRAATSSAVSLFRTSLVPSQPLRAISTP